MPASDDELSRPASVQLNIINKLSAYLYNMYAINHYKVLAQTLQGNISNVTFYSHNICSNTLAEFNIILCLNLLKFNVKKLILHSTNQKINLRHLLILFSRGFNSPTWYPALKRMIFRSPVDHIP